MTEPQRIFIERDNIRIALNQWGPASPHKQPALLVHGTGFVSETWAEIAPALAADHTVYAIDRRGHGASDKPAGNAYQFLDFASDVAAAVSALDLTDVFGIGHSAGATDLLLAARMMPERFSRLFVMEPTMMDPRARRGDDAELNEANAAGLQRMRSRRSRFESADALHQRLRAAPAFAHWSAPSLQAYIQHGFDVLPDGQLQLKCMPEIEGAMLRPIFEAMQQIHGGDHRGNPFELISGIACPVCVTTSERSDTIYKTMSARAVALLPDASQVTFDGAGHCAAQEAPAHVLEAIRAFKARCSVPATDMVSLPMA